MMQDLALLFLYYLKREDPKSFIRFYNEFRESDHPRDEEGKFSDKEEGANKDTSGENREEIEIQKKINSVSIDFSKDNVLPELNKEDLEYLGIKSSYKIRLKKSIIDRNNKEHSDVSKEETKNLLVKSLYFPDFISIGNKPNYFHFIGKEENGKSPLTLLDIEIKDGFLDIVHYFFIRPRARKKEESKK